MRTILLETEGISLPIALHDTPTARAIEKALPLQGVANRWGEEIYFEIPVKIAKAKEAREQVEVGEVGYWPPGHALCVFFGPTPASRGEKPQAASPVNVFGKVNGDLSGLRKVRDGSKVVVRPASP